VVGRAAFVFEAVFEPVFADDFLAGMRLLLVDVGGRRPCERASQYGVVKAARLIGSNRALQEVTVTRDAEFA